ncbi:MAG TPA: branched-chain amino acid ABC transporter permease [Candidatus Angelobacter sp.]|nr:branched-chain amino acid ABC transporter permease [Candidatus Angelobacter sp.]
MTRPANVSGWLRLILPWTLLAALLLLPVARPSDNLIRLLFLTAVYSTAGLGWNLLGGMAGQVSFGFAVFFGLGAYTTALLMHAGHSPYFGFIGGASIAMLASFFIGLPTFRLRGPYFVIATIGVTEAVRVIMNNLDITGGASGYRIAEDKPFNPLEHYYTAIVAVALAVLVSTIIANSKFGLALRAIKQDQDAAADLGVNPFTTKLWIHAFAAGLTGIAGGIYARRAGFFYPGDVFAFQTGINILLIPVIGGIGTIWGPVLGGVVFIIVEETISAKYQDFHLMIYGALLILIVLVEPGGLIKSKHLWVRLGKLLIGLFTGETWKALFVMIREILRKLRFLKAQHIEE